MLKRWRQALAGIGWVGGVTVAAAQEPAVVVPVSDPPPAAASMIDPSAAAAAPSPTAPSAAPSPTAPSAAGIPCPPPCPSPCDRCGFDFSKVPPVRPLPRPGMFPIPPSGPGYYSLLDLVTGQYRERRPQFGYPPLTLMFNSLYDADWRYLDQPGATPDALDRLKRIRLGDNWLLNVGGASWFRYFNEQNSRLTGLRNDYTQVRSRVYTDLWYQDLFRVYVEGIYADTFDANLPLLPTDATRFDFLNLFVDLKLGELADKGVYVRVGRQELLLGSQRLVSPLDWANTRRTFQGVRLFRTGEQFDFDLFWLQPVIPNQTRLDSIDNNQNFVGAWATYKPKQGTYLDVYYLLLDNTNAVTQQGIVRSPITLHTFGSRLAGDIDNTFLWDFEAAMQLGRRGNADVVAAMATAGLGYHAAEMLWNPTFWIYYDYASGDGSPNSGKFTTFNHLFPFGHYYFGWADIIGRQNIHDLNLALYLYPAPWLTLWLQYHNFWLARRKDALYGVAGQAIRRDPTGAVSPYVGQELDVIVNVHLSKRTDLMFSYAHLFAGGFLRQTQPPGTGSPDVGVLALIFNTRW